MSTPSYFDVSVGKVNQDTLLPIVRKALQEQRLVLKEWRWTSFNGTGGGIGNSAVYRFSGSCEVDGLSEVGWSVILKIVRYQESTAESGSHYWRREFDAYQSGWLNDLPTDSFRAPVCYEAEVFPGEAVWLWLEDLRASKQKWSRHSLAIAARHLGQFNGVYVTGKELPNYAWLSSNWISGDIHTAAQFLPQLGTAHEGTFLSRIITDERRARCLKIYDERMIFLKALDRLPKTIQHLDAFSRNMFLMDGDGVQKTVAIDWAFVGKESIGAELPSLFWVTLLYGDVDASEAANYERDIFESYIDGLRDAGWNGDANLVRIGFNAALGLRHFGTMCYAQAGLQDEDATRILIDSLGLSYEYAVEQWRAGGAHADTLMDQAQQLINTLM